MRHHGSTDITYDLVYHCNCPVFTKHQLWFSDVENVVKFSSVKLHK